MKTRELYNIFKNKSRKLKQRFLKNQKIDKISIDSVRGFMTYTQLKQFINDKTFCDSVDYTHATHKFRIIGTGIYLKVIAKDAKIYYTAYAMSQYYRTDNPKNRAKLENILCKTKITSVDIAFDSHNMIQLPAIQGAKVQKVSNTTYIHLETLKICLYDKSLKARTQNPKKTHKTFSQSQRALYRLEITLQVSNQFLKKNKRLKRPHAKSTRLYDSKQALKSLIRNHFYQNRQKTLNLQSQKPIPKTKAQIKRLFKNKKVFLNSLDNKKILLYNSNINQRKRVKIQI